MKTLFKNIIPDRLNHPARFAEVAQKHLNAIAWKRQDYIPLGIIVNNPDNIKGISYNQWLDAAIFFEAQAKILRDTLSVGSDYMPVLPINHLGDVLIPTMFGAELLVPSEIKVSFQDQGPSPFPVIGAIKAVDDLRLPDMTAGIMPDVTKIITAWRQWAPSWVEVVTPFPLGPFSLAAELRGTDFFLDIMDNPEQSHKLLSLCAEIQVQTELHLRGLIGQRKNLSISNFGVYSRGRRMGDDTIINLAPDMIAKFAVPYIEIIARRLGPATVHFCTLAERRSDHVFEPLAASPHIVMASTQFGFEYYEKHIDQLEGRLAIESFYGEGMSYVVKKYGSFEKWAKYFVPRFKHRSGLILYFTVNSVEEGKFCWEVWQDAHQF